MSKKKKDRDVKKQKQGNQQVSPKVLLLIAVVGCLVCVLMALAGGEIEEEYNRERKQNNPKSHSKPTTETEQKFLAWPGTIKLGAGDGVGLVKREGWGWAVQAQSDIQPNSTLLTLPSKPIITVRSVLSSITDERAKEVLESAVYFAEGSVRHHQMILTLAILLENRKPNSFWKPWLDALPLYTKNFMSDVYWTETELRCVPELQQKGRQHRLNTIRDMIQLFNTPSLRRLLSSEISKEEVTNAFSIVIRRAWWRQSPDYLALYPVFDITDQRVRQGPLWRPLSINSAVHVEEDSGRTHLVATELIKKGSYAVSSPLIPMLPSDAAAMFGIVDPDFEFAASALDLQEYSSKCTQHDMLIYHNGTATQQTLTCLEHYLRVSSFPEKEKSKKIRNFLAMQAEYQIPIWKIPAEGECSAKKLAKLPHGTEILNMMTSHTELFQNMQTVYKKRK